MPVVTILGLIIFLGWWVVFEVFTSIIKVHYRTRKTLEIIGQEIPSIPDEVKSLESIMGILSSKVKSGFEQLKEFSQKTEELNKEVSQKVFVLSAILQANDLFSKQAPSEEIIQFLIQHLKEVLQMKMCFCSLKRASGDDFNTVACLGIDLFKIEEILKKESANLIQLRKIIVIDKENKPPLYFPWTKKLEVKSMVLSPITSRGKLVGILCMGNSSDNSIFTPDELNILSLFSQNIGLVWAHKNLSLKVEELEIFDYLTGLYNEKFISKRLDEEIKRAIVYQRPCGFLTAVISNYKDYQREFGIIAAEKLLKKAAMVFKETLRPIDIIGRTGFNKLATILIEKNRRQSQEVASMLKEKLEYIFKDKIKLAFFIAENPLNGTSAQELANFIQSQISASETDEIS